MLDYKSMIRLKKLGLNNSAIANRLECKWDTVQRIISRCENNWGSVEGVPEDYSNEEIADMLFTARNSVDLDYLQPDCEKILEKQRQGYLRNELWADYCAEAAKLGKKAYKLSRFNEIVSEYRSKHDISFTMNHVPGLEGQADWTGDHGHCAFYSVPVQYVSKKVTVKATNGNPWDLYDENGSLMDYLSAFRIRREMEENPFDFLVEAPSDCLEDEPLPF